MNLYRLILFKLTASPVIRDLIISLNLPSNAMDLYFCFYNFVRFHRTLRMTPAMEAGVIATPPTIKDLVEMAWSVGIRNNCAISVLRGWFSYIGRGYSLV